MVVVVGDLDDGPYDPADSGNLDGGRLWPK